MNERKLEHIEVLLSDADSDRSKHYFERIMLKHHALPELDLGSIDTSTTFLGKRLSFPFLISSMTGGRGEQLSGINRNLARAAQRTGVAMGVGSQRVMFSDESARSSFELRELAPDIPLCANLGAIQLVNGFGIDECRAAVAALDADALILHLNPLQEICQSGGDSNFAGIAAEISSVVSELDLPVIVKEVGAGICDEDIERLIDCGVEYMDLAGTGGVSWSRVEGERARRKREKSTYAFDDWGVPTPLALEMASPYRDRTTLIASGGLRSGIDMAKALALGASLCGMARPLLEPAMDSENAVVEFIEWVRDEFQRAMFLLGCGSLDEMIGNEDLIL